MTAIIFLLLSVIISNYHISVEEYRYVYSDSPSVKIVFLSDLHGKTYGANNSGIITKIREQSPDVICLGGDFIDEDNTYDDNREFIQIIDKLVDIAPVYYSYGNHDMGYLSLHNDNIFDEMEQHGCNVLEEEYVDIDINGIGVRLGGMYDYAFNQQYLSAEDWMSDSTCRFLIDFISTDRTKILLCHRPDSFIYEDAANWDIDYVLCGHTHGGIWRFPIIGGLIAPEQGFLPEYDKGEYNIGNIKMIISSGLSGYKKIPRLFNSPEITVIEFN